MYNETLQRFHVRTKLCDGVDEISTIITAPSNDDGELYAAIEDWMHDYVEQLMEHYTGTYTVVSKTTMTETIMDMLWSNLVVLPLKE